MVAVLAAWLALWQTPIPADPMGGVVESEPTSEANTLVVVHSREGAFESVSSADFSLAIVRTGDAGPLERLGDEELFAMLPEARIEVGVDGSPILIWKP